MISYLENIYREEKNRQGMKKLVGLMGLYSKENVWAWSWHICFAYPISWAKSKTQSFIIRQMFECSRWNKEKGLKTSIHDRKLPIPEGYPGTGSSHVSGLNI